MSAHPEPTMCPISHAKWCQRMADLSVSAYLMIRRTPFFLTPSAQAGSDDIAQLTGFTGSQACLLWWPTGQGVLYTDDRYTLQARQQSPHVTVVHSQDMISDVAQRLHDDSVAINGWMWTVLEASKMPFATRIVWDHTDAPHMADPLLLAPIHGLPNPTNFQDKCQHILGPHTRDEAWIVCDPALVSWWINARSLDHPTTPLINGYLLIQRTQKGYCGVLGVSWPRTVHELDPDITVVPWEWMLHWLGGHAMEPSVCSHPETHGPRASLSPVIAPHDQASVACSSHPLSHGSIMPLTPERLHEALPLGWTTAWRFDPSKTPRNMVQPSWIETPITAKAAKARSVKNDWEQHHARQAHVRDSVAWVEWLTWLNRSPNRHTETEITAAQQLAHWRAQHSSYVGPSFEPISAAGSHSAMIHYHPQPHTACILTDGLYLMDSGGQYHYGTTDVTRTVWLGPKPPPLSLKRAYTAVLQGLIHGISLRFPPHTTGAHIDAIIRSFVWHQGWDYAHSTGHGVGSFLSVHEAPPTLSQRAWTDALLAGQITSLEPGYYHESWGGVRLENVALVTADASVPQWLTFESLTLVPFDHSLLFPGMLSYAHQQWLDCYHKRIYQTLSPLLSPEARQWLSEHTRPLAELA